MAGRFYNIINCFVVLATCPRRLASTQRGKCNLSKIFTFSVITALQKFPRCIRIILCHEMMMTSLILLILCHALAQVEVFSTLEPPTHSPLFCKAVVTQPLLPSPPTLHSCSTGPTLPLQCLQTTTSSPHTPPPFSRPPPPSRPSPASATASLPLLLPFKDHLSPCLASLL